MSDWEDDVETPDVITWQREARALQQNMFLRLGDREWDELDESDIIILERKVGFGLYPIPENHPEEYTYKQIQNIKLISEVILKNVNGGSVINFSCIFIFGKIKDEQFFTPVFKVKGKENQALFVDAGGITYENWSDYLNSNRLPKCIYCYPRDGLYQGQENQVLIDFGASLAYDTKSKFLPTFATSKTMTSLFPSPIGTPISDVMQKISGNADDTIQSATNVQNNQLNKSEEKMNKPRMKKIALHMARSRIQASIAQAAASGEVEIKKHIIRQHVNAAVTYEDLISLVCNTSPQIVVRHISGYLNFFSNRILKEGTVKEIIGYIQEKILNHHCDDLTEEQIEEFFQLSERVEGKSQLHKNANKVKVINHMGDKQNFYENLQTLRGDLEGHKVQFSLEDPGLLNIDDEFHIAPNKLVQISEADRQQILEATQKVKDSDMDDTAYWRNIETILKENRVKMQYQRRQAIAQLKQAFEINNLDEVRIGNKQIFMNMAPSELDRLSNVMADCCKSNDPRFIKIANEFAQMRNCKSPRDYCNYVEFVAKHLIDLKNQKEAEYQEALNDAKANKDFVAQRFGKDYGIRGKRAVHFANQVLEEFDVKRRESFEALEQLYTNLEKVVLPLNATTYINFASNASAVCHYFKHSDFGSTQLTPEEYFKIASELVSEPLNERSAQLNQQGDKTMIVFTNPINGAKGVVFEKLADQAQSLATFFYDKRVLNRSD